MAGILDLFRMQPAPVPLRGPAPVAAKALSDVAVPFERDWTVNWPWQDAAGGMAAIFSGSTTNGLDQGTF